MANVQFFHSVLIGLIAMTLVSGAMTGVSQKLMPVHPPAGVCPHDQLRALR